MKRLSNIDVRVYVRTRLLVSHVLLVSALKWLAQQLRAIAVELIPSSLLVHQQQVAHVFNFLVANDRSEI